MSSFCPTEKTEDDVEREARLVEQWVGLTEERNAVLVPAPGSGIPGAPADWWVRPSFWAGLTMVPWSVAGHASDLPGLSQKMLSTVSCPGEGHPALVLPSVFFLPTATIFHSQEASEHLSLARSQTDSPPALGMSTLDMITWSPDILISWVERKVFPEHTWKGQKICLLICPPACLFWLNRESALKHYIHNDQSVNGLISQS